MNVMTSEQLFKIEAEEKILEGELTKQSETLYDEMIEYVASRQKWALESQLSTSPFSIAERAKNFEMYEESQKLYKKIITRRQVKIIQLALDYNNNNELLIDKSLFRGGECQFFDAQIKLFREFAKNLQDDIDFKAQVKK